MAKKERKLPIQTRTIVLEPGDIQRFERGEGANKVVVYRFSISSEYEVERYDYWTGERYVEVLSHDKDAVDVTELKNRAPLLHMHDPYDQIGVVEDGEVGNDRKGYAEVRFSRVGKGPDFETDFNDRVRTKVSVRYWTKERKVQKADAKNPVERRVSTKWGYREVSIVSMAADPTVGPGRSATEKDVQFFPVVDDDGESVTTEETRDMTLKAGEVPSQNTPAAAAVADHPADGVRYQVDDAPGRAKRIDEIRKLCKNNEVPPAIQEEYVRGQMSASEVAESIIELTKSAARPQPSSETIVALTDKEASQYSYARAVDGVYVEKESRGRDRWTGFEKEIHEDIMKRMPSGYDYKGGALIPLRLRPKGEGQRAMDTKTLGKGSEIVAQQPGELIELLRESSALGRAGARFLTGLTTKIPFPKKKSGMTFNWVAENPAAGVADSDIGLGISWLDPKALAGMNIFSRQLLLMALTDMDQLIRDEIAEGTGLAIDLAGIHGKGGEGVPLGIYKTPGVTPKAFGGAPTFANTVDLFAQVRKKNGLRGRPTFITTPEMAGKLMTVPTFTNGVNGIWTGDFDTNGRVVGYPAFASNQVSATMATLEDTGGTEHGIIAGNIGDLLVGTFAALEVTADPYTLLDKAMVRLFAYVMCDTLLRHGESVAVSTGATLV